jgi:hypothetical protein
MSGGAGRKGAQVEPHTRTFVLWLSSRQGNAWLGDGAGEGCSSA